MTRYKKEFKKHGFKFAEDFDVLPYYDSINGVTLEDAQIFFNHDLFFITHFYDEIGTTIYCVDKDFIATQVNFADDLEDRQIKRIVQNSASFRIYDDMPSYKFFYDTNENLIFILKERGF